MAYPIDAEAAREILDYSLRAAEEAYRNGPPPTAAKRSVEEWTERLFTSATQAYREALIGCAVARIADERIDIRLPSTESGENSFSGRSLADQVVTPFLRDHAIPASVSPYLSSLRGGARFVPGGAPRIQRDAEGFFALVSIVQYLAGARKQEAESYLIFLLHRFVRLRESSRLNLTGIAKPNLVQFDRLIAGLLNVKSGGRFPALLATAMFQTLSECHNLGWAVEFQGINVADRSSGAVGDITIRKEGKIILGVEVTERTVDRGRVTLVFEQKVTPSALADYLFITTTPPDEAAQAAARGYTAVGHEMNFVSMRSWLVNNLATIGPRCRAVFQARMLDLLADQNADLKVAWNANMETAIGI